MNVKIIMENLKVDSAVRRMDSGLGLYSGGLTPDCCCLNGEVNHYGSAFILSGHRPVEAF